jgi:uncharacterized membrane protein YbhN (UPF0104 family)
VRARLVRDSVAVALPFSQIGGFAAGIRVLALSGVPTAYCGFSMFADLLAELASLLPYVAMGLAALAILAPSSGLLKPLAISASAVAAFMLAGWLARRQIVRWFRTPAAAVAARLTGTNPGSLMGARRDGGTIDLSYHAIAANMALHFGRWAIGAVETCVAFVLMGVHISLANALIVDCITAALRVFVFMVPAAIGVQEGSYVLVCGIIGLPPAIALAFSFIWRARDLLIGFLGLAVWHADQKTAGAKRNQPLRGADSTHFQGI